MRSTHILSFTACMGFALFLSTSTLAQTPDASSFEASSLEEIVVTGRKRDESLIDVPVSISVWNANSLAEQGIVTQQDLFDATVGLDYTSPGGIRTNSTPGIRGVQAPVDLPAPHQQKVSSFIDGLPTIVGAGSLQFSGIDAIEVYRGPQSAAFGRSTFAGAINYVSADATEEFSGKVHVRLSDLGDEEFGALISGPIGDKLGYRISYLQNEFTGPDQWTSNDGHELGSEETKQLTAKLNFEFSDTAYGEIMYTRFELDDAAQPSYFVDPATCRGDSGIFLNTLGAEVQLPSGKWDCPTAGQPLRNHDALGQYLALYEANSAAYNAMYRVSSLDQLLGLRTTTGETFEQALLARSPTGERTIERDRVQGEMNFEVGDSLLKFLGMWQESDGTWFREQDFTDSAGVFGPRGPGRWGLNPNVLALHSPPGSPTKEKYGEVRWISPADESLRYTLAASWYDYSFNTKVFLNGGALVYGLTLPDGRPVNPLRRASVSEDANNVGVSASIQYDINDSTTLSLEGRYQVDDICGTDQEQGLEHCKETKALLPRVAISSAFSNNHTAYAQAAIGNNPGGVNIAYTNPNNVEALLVASGQIPSPNDGIIYDGSDGVHFPAVAFDADAFNDFEEEKLYSFEIGSKGNFAEGRGSYTAAVYYLKFENSINVSTIAWDDDTPNGWNVGGWNDFTAERTHYSAGDGESYGLELTANYAFTNVWTVGGYIALMKASYTDSCSISVPNYRDAPGGARGVGNFLEPILTPANDGVEVSCGKVDGNDIPRQSPVSANLNISATLPNEILGLRTSFRADVRHRGPYYEDPLNALERNAVTTLNLSANMRNENWRLRFYIDNVTDEDEPTRISLGNFRTTPANPALPPANNGAWLMNPRRPREYGLQLEYAF